MTNAKMTISPERWKEMDENERTWIVYDTLVTLDKRVIKLEKGGIINKSLTFAGGAIGGIVFWLGIKIWG